MPGPFNAFLQRRARRRADAVRSQRLKLLEDYLQDDELVLEQAPAVIHPTAAIQHPFPVSASHVIFFTTTERVIWVSHNENYEPEPFGGGGLVRYVEYPYIKDFLVADDGTGESLAFLVVHADSVPKIDGNSKLGMTTMNGLADWGATAGLDMEDLLWAIDARASFHLNDLVQVFLIPVLGPWWDGIVGDVRSRIGPAG